VGEFPAGTRVKDETRHLKYNFSTPRPVLRTLPLTPKKSDLTPLARAGVLWLNAVLTVRAHKANSHQKKGWEELTAAAIRAVLQRDAGRGVVFMAWGLPAQKTLKALGVDEVRSPSSLHGVRGLIRLRAHRGSTWSLSTCNAAIRVAAS
jgi:uracil DNA glycosylase